MANASISNVLRRGRLYLPKSRRFINPFPSFSGYAKTEVLHHDGDRLSERQASHGPCV